MSDTRSELKKLVPLYCDELNSLDLSLYENYEFSIVIPSNGLFPCQDAIPMERDS